MLNEYDVIIVGAGHNGLVTAGYLARAGLRALVLESRPVVGGACVTEEIFPGFKVSTTSYLCSLLQEKVIEDLEMEKFGYQVYPKDPAFFSPFPDGRYLILWSDTGKTCEEIRKFSVRDAEAYPQYEDFLDRLAQFVEPLLLETPPDVARRGFDDWQKLAGLGQVPHTHSRPLSLRLRHAPRGRRHGRAWPQCRPRNPESLEKAAAGLRRQGVSCPQTGQGRDSG